MTKAMYLIGPPGSGKSSVMAALLDQLGLDTGWTYQPWEGNQLRLQPLHDIVTGTAHGTYLGVNRSGPYPGTDALGRAVGPDACAWLQVTALPDLVLGEGFRLSTMPFLTSLDDTTHLTVVHLDAADTVLDARRTDRGQEVAERQVKAATTQCSNLVRKLRGAGVDVVERRTDTHTADQIAADLVRYTELNEFRARC